MGKRVQTMIQQLDATCRSVEDLATAAEEAFLSHPDLEAIISFGGAVRHSHSKFEQTYHLGVPAYDFPQDLLDAQAALDEVQAERDRYRPETEGSSGYTPEQTERLAGYRARVLELTTFVLTHPYWATLSGPDRVEARTALKQAHDDEAGPEA